MHTEKTKIHNQTFENIQDGPLPRLLSIGQVDMTGV